MGPNHVKNTKSNGWEVMDGDTIGVLSCASLFAFALLSFRVSERLSASMQLRDQRSSPGCLQALCHYDQATFL